MMRKFMRSTRRNPCGSLFVLLFVLSLSAACQAKDSSPSAPSTFPPELLGIWQVAEVHKHRNSGFRPLADYKNNIHKYLGRVFVFTSQQLTHNVVPWDSRDKRLCENPRIVVHRSTAAKAIGASLCDWSPDLARATPKDFQLPLSDNTPIEALALICKDGPMSNGLGGCQSDDKPSADEIRGAWLIVLSPDQLVLRWDNEAFLTLKRLPKDAKPVASFDCTKAASPTEKTICASVSLAAYDVSVTETYKFALGYYQFALETYNSNMRKQTIAQIAAFKKSQQEWLSKRDACGSDAPCLDKAMGERVWQIEYEITEYAAKNSRLR